MKCIYFQKVFHTFGSELHWVVPEKIHTPPTEEISAIRRGRGEKIVSDNSKCMYQDIRRGQAG
jgi:hypothetical protein